jgi:site-specific recombinase XerD
MARRTSTDIAQLTINFGPDPVMETGVDGSVSSTGLPPLDDSGRRGKPDDHWATRHPRAWYQVSIGVVGPASVIDTYLSTRADLRPNTVIAYRRDLSDFADSLDPHDVIAATVGDLRAWIQARMRDPDDPSDPRPCSPRTMARKLASIAGLFAWGRKAGLVTSNPCDLLEPIVFTAPIHPVVSAEMIERLFDVIELAIARESCPRRQELLVLDAAIYRLCYHLGLRVTEASRVRTSMVRRVDGELRIEVETKGGQVREFPITGHVLAAWHRWMSARIRVTPVPGAEDIVFLHPWTGYPVSRRRAWKRLRRHAHSADLPRELLEWFTPHSLRHAYAQELDRRGTDLRDIRDALGHRSVDDSLYYLRASSRTSRRLDVLREGSRDGTAEASGLPKEEGS